MPTTTEDGVTVPVHLGDVRGVNDSPPWADDDGSYWEGSGWEVELVRDPDPVAFAERVGFPEAAERAVLVDLRPPRMVVPFWQGSAHTEPPTAADVLECLLSDAAGIENARDFSEWCAEYGYDDDSRRAYATWEAATAQTEALRDLLGEHFDGAVFPEG